VGQVGQVGYGEGQEQCRADDRLSGREMERVHGAVGREPADERDVPRPYHRGGEYQDVSEPWRVQPRTGGEQPDGQDAQARGEEERPGQPAAAAPVQQGGEHDGEADDQSGVGGARVCHPVGLQHENGGLGDSQERSGADLAAGPAPTARGDEGATRESGDGVPGEQHRQDGERRSGRLGRQIAGAPDERDQEEYRIGAAGDEHAPTLHHQHVEDHSQRLKQTCRSPTLTRWMSDSCGSCGSWESWEASPRPRRRCM
jgi:hypothetical protein